MQLKPLKYNRIDKTEIEIGLIAEQVLEIYPELVDINENGVSGIKYTRLTALLLESIKIMNKKLDEQQKLINRLLK
jgi:capsule polysaccharide export protein KpsE/RkpR